MIPALRLAEGMAGNERISAAEFMTKRAASSA